MAQPPPVRILYLAEPQDTGSLARLVLSQEMPDVRVEAAHDGLGFAAALLRGEWDVVITEFNLPWGDCFEVQRLLREQRPRTPIILFASRGSEELAVRAIKAGFADYLTRAPHNYEKLAEAVRQAIAKSARLAERQAADDLRDILDKTGVGVFTCTADGKLLKANPAFYRITGAGRPDHFDQFNFHDLLRGPGQWADLQRRLASRGKIEGALLQLHPVQGGEAWVRLSATLLGGPASESLVQGILLDLTREEAARQQMETRIESLQRINGELELFASRAAHDLQEPLRTVCRFAEALAGESRNALKGPQRDYLDLITESAGEMQKFVNDLLAYSRVVAKGGEMTPVRPDELIDAALIRLDAAVRESKAEIRRGRLPHIFVNPPQIESLFLNLIGNAIRYRAERPLEIAIEAENKGAEVIFSIRDNGIGIKPDQREVIFEPFRTGGNGSGKKGTGLGLALCKRVLEHHGGRIWVESEEGNGSVFHFSLPNRIAAAGAEPNAGLAEP